MSALLGLLLSAHLVVQTDDFKTADGVVKALYDVISGPAGQKRDWNRMRSLFAPKSQMTVIFKTKAGEMRREVLTVEDYVKISGPYLEKNGFFEKEVARRTEEFGGLMHVWSTYESRKTLEDEKPFERGINSIGLWFDGKRWWIEDIAWRGEDPTTPLPSKYLNG